MTEKTIKEVVAEFKAVFGAVEYIATNNVTGQQVQSKGWVEPAPMVDVSSDDYLKLKNGVDIKHGVSPQAVGHLLKLAINQKTK